MTKRAKMVIATAAVSLFSSELFGQAAISLTGPSGSTYTQNFDPLNSQPAAANSVSFVNGTTLPGWYAGRSNPAAAVPTGTSTGSSGTGGLYYLGVAGVNPVSDRALGSVGSGTSGHWVYGAQFLNNASDGGVIDSITITYTGEQWRVGTAGAAQTMFFNYRVGGATWDTPPQTGGSTGSTGTDSDTPSFAANHVSGLDFSNPNVGTADNQTLDGNLPAIGNAPANFTQ